MKDNTIVMAYLNELESAVLLAMCERETSEPNALAIQVKNAEVTSRKNTGSGFYTYLKVDPSCITLKQEIFSNIFVDVIGLNNPMTFILFVQDGYIFMLEGASIEDNTVNIDFQNVEFRVL